MRKIIFAIAALMICVLVLGPYASGVWFQKKYLEFVSSVDASHIFQIIVLDYHRGWMSSDITSRVVVNKKYLGNRFDDEDILKEIPVILVKQHVQHGPLFYEHSSGKLFGLAHTQSDITVLDENDIHISDVSVEDFTEAVNNYVNAGVKINIRSLQFENQLIGPIDLTISVHKLYLPAIHDLFTTITDFIHQGEIYQGQLKQKILSILPKIISAGSSINLDELHVALSSKIVTATGAFDWSEKDFLPPTDLREVIFSGQGKLNIKISEKLMKDILYLASTLPDFIRDVAEPQRPLLMETQKRMEFAIRQNLLFIDDLSERGYISKQTEDILVSAQNDFIPMDDYAKMVKDLFLDRQITLVVSYQLCGQYAQIIKSYQFLTGSVKDYQKIAEKQIRDIFKGWIKKGYVKEKNGDYTAILQWTEKSFTSNGLEVK